ncbi:MAG: BatD family protein [Saprospiraceae bacterium]
MKLVIQIVSVLALIGSVSKMTAQQTEVNIKVQDTVAVGSPFTLEVELKNIQGSFKTPDFQGLRLVGGPQTSSSFSMINGVTTSSATYTYYLMAEQEGLFSILLHPIEKAGDSWIFEEIPVVAVTSDFNHSQVVRQYHSNQPTPVKSNQTKRKLKKI